MKTKIILGGGAAEINYQQEMANVFPYGCPEPGPITAINQSEINIGSVKLVRWKVIPLELILRRRRYE